MPCGDCILCGFDHAVRPVHDRHCRQYVRIHPARHCPQYGAAQQNGFRFARYDNAAAGGIGMLSHENRIFRPASAGRYGLYAISCLVHLLDDMTRAVSDGLNRRQVLPCKIAYTAIQAQARNCAFQGGIRKGRPVPVMMRQYVQIIADMRRKGLMHRQTLQLRVQDVIHGSAGHPGLSLEFRSPGMSEYDVIHQSPGCALASFGQP